MKRIKIKKDNHELEVTEKAFRVLFRDKGYKEVKANAETEKENQQRHATQAKQEDKGQKEKEVKSDAEKEEKPSQSPKGKRQASRTKKSDS